MVFVSGPCGPSRAVLCPPCRGGDSTSAALLPDKPLDGSGSRSDWMGSAGDFSREAAPACSHAQLSTHSAARSARRCSIPDLRLVSAPTSVRKTPHTLRTVEAPIEFIQNLPPAGSSSSSSEGWSGLGAEISVSSAPRLSSEPRPRSVL